MNYPPDAAIVWRYDDAPAELKRLVNPDDIDYIAWVPDALDAEIGWALQNCTSWFGCCSVEEHKYKGGHVYGGHRG